MELLYSELTELRTTQVRTAKESEKYREERDAMYSEYKLIVSECDQVISELDKLQTELKRSTSEKKVAKKEMEALQQIKDTMTMDAGRANKEVEILRKQCKALCQELKEALQGVDVAKCHLDWAFQERDKIVAEQHSIQTLCNNLRRERDRDQAVSELPEALRSLDDSWKQKIDVSQELKELKEQMESQLEKEARFRQLMAHTPHDLAIDTDSMEKDDILYMDDTLPQGTFGSWMAWQLDQNAQKIQRGQIPSKYVMNQEFSRRLSMSEVKDDSSAAKTLLVNACHSFFRRKHKHKRSGSKDEKDLLALDTFSNDSIPVFEDSVSLAYQHKVDCTSLRPPLILGLLLDVVKEMLVNEAPGKFCRCPLKVMKVSQQAIERGVKDCLFVDYTRRSGHFDLTMVVSIKEITDKN
ncbi:Disks large-like protein 5 [Sciurus carolinensis]|uniref:Disks large-like protein 5 n=1 Tax=Sciurus carolinensis TaxID=30640 RepID=A0AA41MFT4_SCICA|nr:Disks large-like protein 5 [Sciurus carolinensis]